jgi:hypothetical protein
MATVEIVTGYSVGEPPCGSRCIFTGTMTELPVPATQFLLYPGEDWEPPQRRSYVCVVEEVFPMQAYEFKPPLTIYGLVLRMVQPVSVYLEMVSERGFAKRWPQTVKDYKAWFGDGPPRKLFVTPRVATAALYPQLHAHGATVNIGFPAAGKEWRPGLGAHHLDISHLKPDPGVSSGPDWS